MKLLYIIFIFLIVFSCNSTTGKDKEKSSCNTLSAETINTEKLSPGLQDRKSGGYLEKEIIVKFVNGTDPKTISVIQKELGLETLHTFSSPNLFLMKITDNTPVKSVMKSLNKYKEVKYSEPNYKMSIDSKKGRKP